MRCIKREGNEQLEGIYSTFHLCHTSLKLCMLQSSTINETVINKCDKTELLTSLFFGTVLEQICHWESQHSKKMVYEDFNNYKKKKSTLEICSICNSKR